MIQGYIFMTFFVFWWATRTLAVSIFFLSTPVLDYWRLECNSLCYIYGYGVLQFFANKLTVHHGTLRL